LAPYHQENKAICTACNTVIRCCKIDLIRHSQRIKHIKNINLKKRLILIIIIIIIIMN